MSIEKDLRPIHANKKHVLEMKQYRNGTFPLPKNETYP
jgi:hypothetical protein